MQPGVRYQDLWTEVVDSRRLGKKKEKNRSRYLVLTLPNPTNIIQCGIDQVNNKYDQSIKLHYICHSIAG